MDKKLLILDLDGTLIDSAKFHSKTFKDSLDAFDVKYNFDVEKEFKKYMGIRFREIVKIMFPNLPEDLIEKIHKKKWELSHKEEYFNLLKPNEKIIDLLKQYKDKAMFAMFSSSKHEFIERVLKHFDILDLFSIIIGGDDVSHGKPDPEGLYIILEKLKPKDVMFVGDTKFDEESAKKAGIKFSFAWEIEKIKKFLEEN